MNITKSYAGGPAVIAAVAAIAATSLSRPALADFIYQPVNPAFGGSPLMEDYLIGTAQIQNKFVNQNSGGGGGGGGAPDISFPPIVIDLGGGGSGEPAAGEPPAVSP